MARTITLRYPATCRDCGAALEAGDRARYYGRGKVYGIGCHESNGTRRAVQRYNEGAPMGEVYSLVDPGGFYSADGTKIGSGCNCIDYPCCGH